MSGAHVYRMHSSRAAELVRPFVVVVDDEGQIASSLVMILETNGYEAEAAHDGESALEICQRKIPDLVLSDVLMPGMNGIELAIGIRQRFRDCHILLFSGQADIADILEDAKSRGHDFELLAKPIHPDNLLIRIKELIGPDDVCRQLRRR